MKTPKETAAKTLKSLWHATKRLFGQDEWRNWRPVPSPRRGLIDRMITKLTDRINPQSQIPTGSIQNVHRIHKRP